MILQSVAAWSEKIRAKTRNAMGRKIRNGGIGHAGQLGAYGWVAFSARRPRMTGARFCRRRHIAMMCSALGACHLRIATVLHRGGHRGVDAGQGMLLLGRVLLVAHLMEGSIRLQEQREIERGQWLSTINRLC